MRVAIAGLLGVAGAFSPGVQASADKDTLFFFFSTESSEAPALARAVVRISKAKPGKLQIRPVILVEDWRRLRGVTEKSPIFQTVRELGRLRDPEGVDIRVFDEEGLRLAAAWKVTRLPAAVLVSRGKAHPVQGSQADLLSLFACER
jgi:hypothetical protein